MNQDQLMVLLIGIGTVTALVFWSGWKLGRKDGYDKGWSNAARVFDRLRAAEEAWPPRAQDLTAKWEPAAATRRTPRGTPFPTIYTMPSQQELARWQAVVDSFDDVSALDDHPPKKG